MLAVCAPKCMCALSSEAIYSGTDYADLQVITNFFK